ncbi:MAG: sugar-binding protein, partial [Bacteroidota bacterium]
MKQIYTLLVGLYLLTCCSLSAQAQWVFTLWTDANTANREAIAPKVATEPTVDGTPEALWNDAAWNRAQYWTLETNANNNPTMTELPSDTMDHYMEWKAVWTDSSIYYLIHVVDDVTTYSDARSAWWRQDGIEFYPYHQGIAPGALNRNDSTSIPWINLFPDVSGVGVVDVQQQDDYAITGAVTVSGNEVFYELKDINWSSPESRGMTPSNGDTMQLAMMVNESDNTDPTVDNRDMKITWAIQNEARLDLGPNMGYIVLTDPNATNIADADKVRAVDNYPNPFTGKTSIRYTLTEASEVKVAVYDLAGHLISATSSAIQPAG